MFDGGHGSCGVLRWSLLLCDFDVHEQGGGGNAGAIFRQQVDVAETLLNAGEGQCALSHKVVLGGLVVVLHHKADQGQLWSVHAEHQGLLPDRVKTIVVYVSGLLLVLVQGDSMDLHSDQGVHDGVLLDADLGQLLPADHLYG